MKSQMTALNDSLASFRTHLEKLSLREQLLMIGGVVILIGFTLFAGCSAAQDQPEIKTSAKVSETASVKPLKLIVVDDPEVAPVAQREWLGRTGQTLEAELWTSAQLVESELCPEADVIYFPGALVGSLAERDWLRPLPTFASRAAFAEGDLSINDFMTLIRRRAMKWGAQTVALASAERVMILGCRRDVLDALELQVPNTWSELSAALEAYTELKASGEPPLRQAAQSLVRTAVVVRNRRR